jgi:hypothetical protein
MKSEVFATASFSVEFATAVGAGPVPARKVKSEKDNAL